MTDLLVDRLHARAVVAAAEDEARVHALLDSLTGRHLDEALARAPVPAGYWCLRRLHVSLRLDPAPADGTLARRWAQAVTDALLAGLSGAGPDVAYFPRPADAVIDLVAALALGRPDREWAWRAAGALTDADPDPAAQPAAAVLAVLRRQPALAGHALSAATVRAGLPAVHRLLGGGGWRRAAALVLTASGHSPDRWLAADAAPPDSTATARTAPVVAGIVDRSPFVAAWRRSRLRQTAATARAWALLAAAEAEPSLLRRPDAAAVLALLPVAADPETAPRPAPAAHDDTTYDDTASEDTAPGPEPILVDRPLWTDQQQPAAGHHDDAPPVSTGTDALPAPAPRDVVADDVRLAAAVTPDRPDGGQPRAAEPTEPARTAVPTAWGGLVHLLATADAAGIPDELFTDPELGGRPASWSLFHLYRLLTGDAPDSLGDPAVRALAGLPPAADPPEPPPSTGQRARLDRHADRWARITAERIGADREDPRALVARITARAGAVESVPGWTEVRLQLADVDIAVRRAGLDLDPGFVPWLGAVVLIRYE